jgi:glutamate-ammonia-ligase adenylyltransferase
MPDLVQLESELRTEFPASWVRQYLASFPRDYFAAFESSEIRHHVELMLQVNDDRPVAVRAWPEADGQWTVAIVGYDAFQLLSTACTLLAVGGWSILEGRVFTSFPAALEPEGSPAIGRRAVPFRRIIRSSDSPRFDRRPRIVDVFRVRPAHHRGGEDWSGFQAELTELVRLLRRDQFDEVHHRLIQRFVASLNPEPIEGEWLEAIDLSFDLKSSPTSTGVRIRARDSFGFLSLTASALALCGIRIVQAVIRTSHERVDDTLWVTDRAGHKITSEERLRELRRSLILIEHFSSRLPQATDPEAALLHFSQFARETMARPDWALELEALEQHEVLDALVRVLGESHFLWEDYLHAQPEVILPIMGDPAEWVRSPSQRDLEEELSTSLASEPTFEGRCRVIRRIRDREIFRADVRSILGYSQTHEQFAAELSHVAEAILPQTYAQALAQARARIPAAAAGEIPASVLCALGKFGGRELGFASDLEVMIVYDDRQSIPESWGGCAASLFVGVAGSLRTILGCRERSTFDLDFRLRPYGKAGAPATSISTFKDYYRAGGPAWGYERQALIKLRVIAGDRELGREVEEHRDRFVYGPEPFDLECYQRMRKLQVEQLVASGTINAKYSPGALVDVEYLVQALQIIHGSEDRAVRTSNTLQALEALHHAGVLSAPMLTGLRLSYQFFRLIIDALRVVRGNAQDLTVPRFGTEEFQRLARRVRVRSADQLRRDLEHRLRETSAIVAEILPRLSRQPSKAPSAPAN